MNQQPETLEIALENARALNRGLEIISMVLQQMEEEEPQPQGVLVDIKIVADVRSLVDFLHHSSTGLPTDRFVQVARIRDALSNKEFKL